MEEVNIKLNNIEKLLGDLVSSYTETLKGISEEIKILHDEVAPLRGTPLGRPQSGTEVQVKVKKSRKIPLVCLLTGG